MLTPDPCNLWLMADGEILECFESDRVNRAPSSTCLTDESPPCGACGAVADWRKGTKLDSDLPPLYMVSCAAQCPKSLFVQSLDLSDLLCRWKDLNEKLAKETRDKSVAVEQDRPESPEAGTQVDPAKDPDLCKIPVIDFLHDQGFGFGYCLGSAIQMICHAADKEAPEQIHYLNLAVEALNAWIKELKKVA